MTKVHTNSDQINRLKTALHDADCIIIGGGAGLSTSAGLTYSGSRFDEHFADFSAKYGFDTMYEGGFYPYGSLEEFWAYWSRYIYINRYTEIPLSVYSNLLTLVQNADYFVLTTNVDHCFQRSGFDKQRLFYTQGDYGLFQCSVPCHKKTYDNEDLIRGMVQEQKNMHIPSELIPRCPVCGKPMTMNLRSDNTFVEDDGWNKAAARYTNYLRQHAGKRIVFLELGVGSNTPIIIKYPFQQMTAQNPSAVYVCVNKGQASAPYEIRDRSICIDDDIGNVVAELI